MKNFKLFLFLGIFILISIASHAQKADSSSVKLLTKLVGTWQVESTYKNGKEIVTKNGVRTMHFRGDAKYVLKDGKAVLDSGTFNTNEGTSEVYLQSATDKSHLQEWKVEIKGKDNMMLRAKKGAKTEGQLWVYSRVKDI